MKKAFIIHGWEGHPGEGWFPWLKKELERNGFLVEVPSMPNSDRPTITAWVSHLRKVVGKLDQDTYFVGHSIGCQAIMRYLETLPYDAKIGGCVFVAGWIHLTEQSFEKEGDREIMKPWLETPISFEDVKKKARKIVAIFSDNDPFVPLTDIPLFEEKLGVGIIMEYEKGHLGGAEKFFELASVLDAVLSIVH